MQKEKIPSLVNEYSQKIKRWSARAFSHRPVEKSKLLSILEVARWVPSCGRYRK
jgi:nitroreductase